MSAAYDPEGWHDMAVAVAGATAALTGLLFVAISINVREIVQTSTLPRRAAGALITVTTPLIISLAILIPGQSDEALGWELLAIGVVIGVILPWLHAPANRGEASLRVWMIGTAIPIAILIIPTLLAGIGLLTDSGGGLYWIVPAFVAAVVGGLSQAWVLMIEILR